MDNEGFIVSIVLVAVVVVLIIGGIAVETSIKLSSDFQLLQETNNKLVEDNVRLKDELITKNTELIACYFTFLR